MISRTHIESALERDNRSLSRSAKKVKKAGRAGDSILIHVNPGEEKQMRRMWGAPSRNPHTGLPEYGIFSKLKKAAGFELWHGKKTLSMKNLKQALTGGIDPFGTKLSNAVTGQHNKPVVDQLGGALRSRYQQYTDETGRDPGYAPAAQSLAHTIAGSYAGGAAGEFGGAAGGAVGGAAGKAAGSLAGKYAMNSALDYSNTKLTPQPGDYSGSKKGATKSLLQRAEALADRPYTPYEGQRVAGMTDNERQASQLARTGNPEAKSYLDKAGSAIDDSLQEFNSDNLGRYVNPYKDAYTKTENDEYDRQNSALLNSKAGAFGGDRAAFASSELNRTHLANLTDIDAKAYDQATSAFFNDATRKQNAAQAYQSVAGDISQLNRQQIQDLMATGGLERTLNQANLDFDYQQFTEARDWDVNNLEPLLRALGTTGQPGANPKGDNTAAAIGAAATIAGAYFQAGGGGGSGSSTPASTSASSGDYVGPRE